MKGRSGRSYGSISVTGVTEPTKTTLSVDISSTSPATSTEQQQAEQLSPEENGRSESATTAAAQIPSQVLSGGAVQSSTSRTPNSPPEHGGNTPNPPTPGNTNSNNSTTLVDPSPQYVTITVDGEAVGTEAVTENASYVTYVEGSDQATLYAAAAAVAANGQNMAYPVYTAVNDTNTIYSGSAQYYTTTTNPGATTVAAYTQESGVTYLVPTTNNNNNNNNNTTSSISVEVAEGQHNISHACRISPATNKQTSNMKSQRSTVMTNMNALPKLVKRHHPMTPPILYPPAKISRIESFNSNITRNINTNNSNSINNDNNSSKIAKQGQKIPQFQEEDVDDDDEEEEEEEDESILQLQPSVVLLTSSDGEGEEEEDEPQTTTILPKSLKYSPFNHMVNSGTITNTINSRVRNEDKRFNLNSNISNHRKAQSHFGSSMFAGHSPTKNRQSSSSLIDMDLSRLLSNSESMESNYFSHNNSSSSNQRLQSQLFDAGGNMSSLSMSSVTKFCPITVAWLLENYETAEGVSLPRSTLYYHYLRHCNEHKLDPVNAASFGKLIRSVFLGLRTRRLGTRGNSKYHYYGIRLKPSSPLVHVTEENDPGLASQNNSPNHVNLHNGSPSSVGHHHHSQSGSGDEGVTRGNSIGMNNNVSGHVQGGSGKRLKTSKGTSGSGGDQYDAGINVNDPFTIQQYLGDCSGALEIIPELSVQIPVEIPKGLQVDDFIFFRNLYREHCESLLEALSTFQLSQVESYWRSFWRTDSPTNHIGASHEYKIMTKEKLQLLCTVHEVQEFVRETDYHFYQTIVAILLPDVLRPIPSSMTQAIRNFAKTLEAWLTNAMIGYPEEMVNVKVSVVNALAQTLRRYTSLNHLAQAARAVLQNQNQITQMLSDLNRVDFHNVEEQASWVCGCSGDMVPNSLEQEFKATLAQQHTLEQWAVWLEGVVDRILSPHLESPRFVQVARHFLLKWSFYSSLVIRDLTLRSAASFGSFHLLRLLYDEYMFYLVENRVAQVTGSVVIAVIGKKSVDGLGFHPSISSSHTIQNVEKTLEQGGSSTSTDYMENSMHHNVNGHNGNSPNHCSSSSPHSNVNVISPNENNTTNNNPLSSSPAANAVVTSCSVVVVTDMLNHKGSQPNKTQQATSSNSSSTSSSSSTSENHQMQENSER